jgi:transcriptional regulator with XRE-family HTH domain
MLEKRLERTRLDLGQFLKKKRGDVSPMSVGLQPTSRRRTPGLRREELATLAGVGVTWYTWLEQGRDINVSDHFLDRISRVLRLDEVERRHLFLLAQKRPPIGGGETTRQLSGIVKVILDDLILRPAYVFNLRWDVIAWNAAADRVFAFEGQEPDRLNMLLMLFGDDRLSARISDWDDQAPLFVASFRRDFAQAPEDETMHNLVASLEEVSPLFRRLWRSQNVHGRCQGRRSFHVDTIGPVEFNHSTLIINAEEHLRLALYAATEGYNASARFADACAAASHGR